MEPVTDGSASVLGPPSPSGRSHKHRSTGLLKQSGTLLTTVSEKQLHHRGKANAIVAIIINNTNTHVLRPDSLAPDVTVTRAPHVTTSRQSKLKTS